MKDVGNLSATEQSAAEKLIPTNFDSKQVRDLKKAYLYAISSAIDSKDGIKVKELVADWMSKGINTSIKSSGDNPSSAGIPEGQTATNPMTKQKIIFKGGKWQ